MKFVLWFLYSTGVRIGSLYIYFGRYFSKKLALLYQGREDTWQKLTTFSSDHKESIWVHCASLGEFEQGRPLIERIRKDFPGIPLVLSFFSPSGYEIRKNYAFADLIIYLPADLDVHNQRLIELIKPSMVIFVKYEFWWNLIRLLVTNHVNVYLISGVFREKDYFFNPILQSFKALLSRYTKIYVQDELSSAVLLSNGISNFEVAGDTRIDSVMVRSKFAALPDRITKYVENKKVIIYGSIWTSDMKVVGPLIGRYTDFIHIIAPHDISDDNIVAIKKMLNQTSSTYTDDQWDSNILIINNIGMLSGLYSIAKYAYIGGGFDKGIHNTLEPAVYGIPVFFGPKYSKFTEATRMIEIETAFSVSEPEACIRWIDTLESDVNKYMKIRDKSNHFFTSNSGATQKIVSDLYPFLSR